MKNDARTINSANRVSDERWMPSTGPVYILAKSPVDPSVNEVATVTAIK